MAYLEPTKIRNRSPKHEEALLTFLSRLRCHARPSMSTPATSIVQVQLGSLKEPRSMPCIPLRRNFASCIPPIGIPRAMRTAEECLSKNDRLLNDALTATEAYAMRGNGIGSNAVGSIDASGFLFDLRQKTKAWTSSPIAS